MPASINDLKQCFPNAGVVEEILIRPKKHANPVNVTSVAASQSSGLDGDHYSGGTTRKRQVTLIQYEHLPVIAAMVKQKSLDANLLRRNIVVSGINLLALKDCIFSIGSAHLKMTGLCHPCSRMEKILGSGGYNAMRGHGGITATIVKNGVISTGDLVNTVEFVEKDSD